MLSEVVCSQARVRQWTSINSCSSQSLAAKSLRWTSCGELHSLTHRERTVNFCSLLAHYFSSARRRACKRAAMFAPGFVMTERMLQRPCTSCVPAFLDGNTRVHHGLPGRNAARLRVRATQRTHVAAHDVIERLASGNTDLQDEVCTVIPSAVAQEDGTECHALSPHALL